MVRSNDELWAAMRLLPRRQQRMVYARYYHGSDDVEIAVSLNIPVRTVERHISQAKKTIENYFENVAVLGVSQTIVHMREKNGTVERENGQRPEKTKTALACIDRPAISQNPSPDTYYESPEREDFMEALADCCSSAIAQVGPSASGRNSYASRAMLSRSRIEAMRKAEVRLSASRSA